MHRKITAVALILLTTSLALASDTNLQNEQISRLTSIKTRAAQNKLTIGDMHESGAHLRVAAARLRDAGAEPQVDSFIKNTNNENALIAKCIASGRKGVTKADCVNAIGMIRANGSVTMTQAVASVAYNADQWGNFIPAAYHGDAHLVPVVLPNCQGAREAVDIIFIVAAAESFIPGAQPAGGITTLFGAILLLAVDKYC